MAINDIFRTVALEVAEHGVRVNAVNPGVIITEVHKNAGDYTNLSLTYVGSI